MCYKYGFLVGSNCGIFKQALEKGLTHSIGFGVQKIL